MSEHFNRMAQHLDQLSHRHTLSKIFNDFLTLSVCAYHPINIESKLQQKDLENELLYMDTIKPYNKEEINTFPQVLAEYQLHLRANPYTDPLGEYFQEHISNGKQGQYFTPDPIATLLAKIQGRDTITHKLIEDPACGSGRLLLHFAKHHPENLFMGSDISPTCTKMAALNFFFHNLSSEINWMDTLSGDWFGGWHINTEDFGIKPIEKEQSYQWQTLQKMKPETKEPPPIILDYRTNTKQQQPLADQLNLFEL